MCDSVEIPGLFEPRHENFWKPAHRWIIPSIRLQSGSPRGKMLTALRCLFNWTNGACWSWSGGWMEDCESQETGSSPQNVPALNIWAGITIEDYNYLSNEKIENEIGLCGHVSSKTRHTFRQTRTCKASSPSIEPFNDATGMSDNDVVAMVKLRANNLNGLIPSSFLEAVTESCGTVFILDSNPLLEDDDDDFMDIDLNLNNLAAISKFFDGFMNISDFQATPITHWPGVTYYGRKIRSIWLPSRRLTGLLTFESFNHNSLHSSLTCLNLSSNGLEGPVPEAINLCQSLLHLDLSWNHFTDIPPLRLSKLRSLNLSKLFSASFDLSENFFEYLREIRVLKLHNTRLTGSLSSAISGLVHARRITLDATRISGDIPMELLGLTQLVHLGLPDSLNNKDLFVAMFAEAVPGCKVV